LLLPPAGIYRVYFLGSQFVLGLMLLRLSTRQWELRDLGLLHLFYLAVICVWGASAPVSGQALTLTGRIAMIWSSADPISPVAVNTCSCIATCYFAVAGWTLTSHRVIRLSDLFRQQLKYVFLVPFPLAVALPCLYASRNWPLLNQGLLIVAVGFLSMRLLPDLLRTRKSTFLRAREEAFRSEAIEVAHSRWTAAALTRDFLQLLRRYFGAENVDLLVLEPEFPFCSVSAGRRLLIEAATISGSLTREAVARQRDVHAPALLAAFDAEDLCAVVAAPGRGGCATVLVGNRPELPPPSWTEVKFAAELARLYAVGVDRAQVARQAMHAQQLALVGYLGSQFRHQARNQLEAIRSVLDLLERGMESSIDQELRSLVLKEVDEIIGDYNMMLDLARPDYDSIQSRALPVAETVREAMRALAPTAKSHLVRFESEIDPEAKAVVADRRLLGHALMNLIRNALQAVVGTPNPAVTVSARGKGERVEFDVADNGPGVPPHVFQNLFTAFNTSKPNGTGLGLSICRNAITMMGGTIDYVTAPGQPHAVFRISLPRANAEAST
jgi:signal transduction histidine kinase